MIHLPDVIMVAVTTKDYGNTIKAIHESLKHIKPAKVLLFTDVIYMDEAWQNIVIDRFKSVEDYNHFIFKKLGAFIETSHVLIIQHDGYVINGDAWDNEFLKYDYIGAPWTYTDGRNVGNGGFSLRSRRLHKVIQNDEFEYTSPEDEKICRYYRQTLQNKYHIRFAPEEVAKKFSFEMQRPTNPTFGFHNYFHAPYKEPIVLKRTGAMGDVIMMEPVMEELHKQGYRVIIDTQEHYFPLFQRHFYPVELLKHVYHSGEDTSQFRVINLDMAYEVEPKSWAPGAYAKACGVNLKSRNPKLIWNKKHKLFDRYIVLHTDDTDMPHRNVHGVDWIMLASEFEKFGYVVIRVGAGNGYGGIKINTQSTDMLAWIIAGADYFIGIDSGCAQIAVACRVESFIFFGSVTPEYRYVMDDKIHVIQKQCPILNDGCYHKVISTVGQDCEVNKERPPCITHNLDVIDHILSITSTP